MSEERYSPFQLIDMHRNNWPEADTPAHTLVLLLSGIRELNSSYVTQTLVRHGLTPSEFDVLGALRRSPPPHEQTPTEILRCTVFTSGGLTKILHHLEERGLVIRVVDEHDRRSKWVRLTDAGRELEEQAMACVLGDIQWMMDGLSAAEFDQLLALLSKMLQARIGSGSVA